MNHSELRQDLLRTLVQGAAISLAVAPHEAATIGKAINSFLDIVAPNPDKAHLCTTALPPTTLKNQLAN